jgi:hypothetical protein
MGMTVKKTSDVKYPTVFKSNNGKVADIPQGVSLVASNLVNGSVLLDGTAIGRASSGLSTVVKSGKILTGSTTTSIKISTKGNQFKEGDKIFSLLNGKHYAITTIVTDTATSIDTMTVGTAIDTVTAGDFIYQNAVVADGATGAALIASPVAITGTSMLVDTSSNLTVDAIVIGAVKVGSIGTVILDALKTNYSSIAQV